MQIYEITKGQKLDEGLLDAVKSAVSNTSLGKTLINKSDTIANNITNARANSAIKQQSKRNTKTLKSLDALKKQGYHVPDTLVNVASRKPLTVAQAAEKSRSQTLDGSIENVKRNPQIIQKIEQLRPQFYQSIIGNADINESVEIPDGSTTSPSGIIVPPQIKNQPVAVPKVNDLKSNIIHWTEKAIGSEFGAALQNAETKQAIDNAINQLDSAIMSKNRVNIDNAYQHFMLTAMGAKNYIETTKSSNSGTARKTMSNQPGNLSPRASMLAHQLDTEGWRALAKLEPTGNPDIDTLIQAAKATK